MNAPRIANIKKISSSNENTLNRDGSEKVIVLIKACKPGYLLINLSNLLTLSTLKTLTNCGPTLKNVSDEAFMLVSKISIIEHITTTKIKYIP